eukprot:TRINITY_DN28933_c0_g1_i1.p1 TRINITY_DN28933_c0_g1~~TRINITY_DN28933_c0_g1_i1.p1  ORF type:complete len:254 (-),score=65.35 TRINITY_DN28933_c0_g1_i1:63-824(-)
MVQGGGSSIGKRSLSQRLLVVVAACATGLLQASTNFSLAPGMGQLRPPTRTRLQQLDAGLARAASAAEADEEASGRRTVLIAAVAAVVAAAGSSSAKAASFPVKGSEEIMKQKAHGTTEMQVQDKLRWNVDRNTADRICSYNRHFAEFSTYWQTTSFLQDANREGETFYDSVTGKPLFVAPAGRSFDAFVKESKVHGWPSFRDEEVVWENVRCLPDGECVSVDGTHLGHNLPDRRGNRYCINLVSVAGLPSTA